MEKIFQGHDKFRKKMSLNRSLLLRNFSCRTQHVIPCRQNSSILPTRVANHSPGFKPLIDSIRHFIRDPSGVFSVCHLCECRIVLLTSRFPPFAFVELVSPYNKKNITRWLEDMNFMFSWKEQYLTRSLRSLVRFAHSFDIDVNTRK